MNVATVPETGKANGRCERFHVQKLPAQPGRSEMVVRKFTHRMHRHTGMHCKGLGRATNQAMPPYHPQPLQLEIHRALTHSITRLSNIFHEGLTVRYAISPQQE